MVSAIIGTLVLVPDWNEQPRAAVSIQVSSTQFEQYIREWSEPEGYFDSDNFISNETSYLHVVEALKSRSHPGGVYLGVGPDQNFSYIAHTKPTLAIIVDIRRQNMLQHLLFKALFEQAATRGDYLALLFAKQKPARTSGSSFEDILKAVRAAPSSEATFQKQLSAVRSILTEKYKIPLSKDDLSKIEYTYRTFWKDNLDLRFESIGRGNASQYPTFENLLLETDLQGRYQNYLATDELFNWMKKFEAENRLIPVVGDFGGTGAFRKVAGFLKANDLQVATFYTSNVEFYLFGSPSWSAFMRNVHALPVAEDSIFIRAYFGNGRAHPLNVRGHRSTSLVHAVVPFLKDYDAGRIPTYWDVVDRRN